MSNDNSISSKTRRRGGRRSQRAKRASERQTIAEQVTALLRSANSCFGEEHDPEGIWGISEAGEQLIDQAIALLKTSAARQDPAAGRSLRRLDDFWMEVSSSDYVTERATAFFNEALEEAQAIQATQPTQSFNLDTLVIAGSPDTEAIAEALNALDAAYIAGLWENYGDVLTDLRDIGRQKNSPDESWIALAEEIAETPAA